MLGTKQKKQDEEIIDPERYRNLFLVLATFSNSQTIRQFDQKI
jgi:hypothetical protein